jgi:hypothetical protein
MSRPLLGPTYLLGAAALAAWFVAGGCGGGLPSSGPGGQPQTATVIVTVGPKDQPQQVLPVEAIVICGGVRGLYKPQEGWAILKGVPFGNEKPPRQPLTVTARGYRTATQWVELSLTAATFADVGLEAVDLAQTGTVEGTVVDQQTGAPLANAHVRFSQQLGQEEPTIVEGFTDNQGQFVIGGIPIGRNQVSAAATGYLEWTDEVVVAQDQGGQNAPLTIKLLSGTATVPVSGIIVNIATEEPISGATVQLGDQTTTSGPDGRFSFPAARVGEQPLKITAPGYDEYRSTLRVVPGLAPLRIELREAAPNPPPPPHNVSGKVTIRNRPNSAGAVVVAYNLRLGVVMDQYTTAADGWYYLLVPPGEYEIKVEYEGRELTRQVTVPGGGRVVSGVDFVITPPPLETSSLRRGRWRRG